MPKGTSCGQRRPSTTLCCGQMTSSSTSRSSRRRSPSTQGPFMSGRSECRPCARAASSETLSDLHSFTKEYTQMYPGVPTPMNPKTAKSFLLFYKTGRKGRIEDAVTDSSADTFWKNFTSAWQRKPGEHFGKPLRDTILNVRIDKLPPSSPCLLIDPTVHPWRGRQSPQSVDGTEIAQKLYASRLRSGLATALAE